MKKRGIKVKSVNNFATAAGLASSSSGLSCLSACLAKVYGLREEFEGQFSMFARLGSGSACRSVYGGVVEWHRGFETKSELEKDVEAVSRLAIAKKVEFDALDYWIENLTIFICVVQPEEGQNEFKDIPSTDGMKLSLETSELLKLRLENDLPSKHITELKKALQDKDFNTFSKVTIQESNQLHAICLDTLPALFYMNQSSKHIANLVRDLNAAQDDNIAAYSIDAGFHVQVFTLKVNAEKVKCAI